MKHYCCVGREFFIDGSVAHLLAMSTVPQCDNMDFVNTQFCIHLSSRKDICLLPCTALKSKRQQMICYAISEHLSTGWKSSCKESLNMGTIGKPSIEVRAVPLCWSELCRIRFTFCNLGSLVSAGRIDMYPKMLLPPTEIPTRVEK